MLTDAQARKAKPGEKDYKLGDSGGLYLYVTTKGYRSWRLKYRYGGREKRLVIGSYPEVSLGVIDLMLAHVPKGLSSSEAAYNRSEHMEQRRELAQEWADLLLPPTAA